jgi:hypothetical protein
MSLICYWGTFSKNVVFLGLLEPKDENTMILSNVKNYSPTDMASHSGRLEFLAQPLVEPEILHLSCSLFSSISVV